MKKFTLLSIIALLFTFHSFTQPSDPGPDNCLTFDGINDQVTMGITAELSELALGDFTLEAWIRTGDVTGGQTVIGNFFTNPAYGMYTYNGYLVFHCGTIVYGSSGFVSDNVWHHVVAVRDFGNDLLMYVDGIQVFSNGSDPNSAFEVEYATMIGNVPNQAYIFAGSIDEVRVWNTVRTEAQIRENMFNVLEGDEVGLVAYYRFDESSGTTLPDITSNALDGTLENMDDADWVASNPFNTWLGTTSSSWATASNWSRNAVPSGENVGIYSFGSNSPVIGAAVSVNNLYLGAGASLTSTADYTITGRTFVNNSYVLTSSSGTATHTGPVYVSSGASLSLGAGSAMNISGTLNNAGTVSMLSPSGNGATGSLITTGTINNTGTMSARRWISAGDTAAAANDYTWHSLSIPMASTNAGTVFPWYWVLNYGESDNSWTNLGHFNDPITRGTGYLVKTIDTPKTLEFNGTFNNGTYNYNLSNTGADASHGYNFVGNPYPSSVDLEALGRTNIGTTFWVYDPVSTNYIFHTVGGGGTLGQYIQPMQGFFVKVNTGSASGTLTFENADRVHNTGGTFYKKSAASDFDRLVLKVSGNEKYDMLFINNRNAVNDAYKFFSPNPEVPMVYVREDNNKFALFNLDEISDGKRVQVGFYAGPSGEYTIEAETQSFSGVYVYLIDKSMDETILLEPGLSYSFNYDENDDDNRFEILFSSNDLLGLKDNIFPNLSVYSSDMKIRIRSNFSNPFEVSVYDLNGRLVTRRNSTSENLSIPVETRGIYLVKVVTSDGGTDVRKVGVF